ncbi:hypothetical protein CCE02nite_22810 [Cellulosimicrobium cellulans]|uniref:Uncharacterized protein n=1 Tax=Cellulosimicrobium cellulans TaxID=1710 RepID=A0A4Y4DY12_CELCE|nr:hypothetical protein CCE02nite_22810 [Cellulosimicrobium cellulans]
MEGRLGRVDRGALEGAGPATLVVDGDDVVGGDGDVRGHAATLAHAGPGRGNAVRSRGTPVAGPRRVGRGAAQP